MNRDKVISANMKRASKKKAILEITENDEHRTLQKAKNNKALGPGNVWIEL